MIKVSLVIPTYNEAKNLPLLLEEVTNLIDKQKIDLEFIIVDDNSPDGTGKIADELSIKYPMRVIHRSGKLGLGSAVIAGFELSDRENIGVMDGDLSHDPAILNNLILSLDQYDLTVGSRFTPDSRVEGWNWYRKIISTTGILLTLPLTNIKDALSGYFFIRRDVIKDVKLTTAGYKILLEILVKGNAKKTKEFSYTFRMRKYSTSKLNFKEFFMFLAQIINYYIYKISKLSYGKSR